MYFFSGKRWMGLVILSIFSFICLNNYSQPISNGARVRTLTVDNGLPQGWITDIAEDEQGFIWMAMDGLCRYDGRNFNLYKHNDKDSSTILKNDILNIKGDDENKIWVVYTFINKKGLGGGLDVVDAVTGHIRHISKQHGFEWMNDEYISFAIEKSGRFFVGNAWHLFSFDPVTGSHKHIILPAGEALVAMGQDKNKNIWLSTFHALYKLQGNQLLKVAALPVSLQNDGSIDSLLSVDNYRLQDILQGDDGEIITTGQDCIFAYNPNTNTKRISPTVSGKMPYGLVKSGKDFYVTVNSNIYQLDKNYSFGQSTQKTTNGNFKRNLLVDKTGTLWAATADATGLRLFDFRSANFISYAYKNGFSRDVLQPWLHNPATFYDQGSYGTRYAKDTAGNIWVLNYIVEHLGEKPPNQTIYKLGNGFAEKFPDYLPENKWQITIDKNNNLWRLYRNSDYHLVKTSLSNGTSKIVAQFSDIINQNGYLVSCGNKICVLFNDMIRVYDTATAKCTIYTKTQLGVDNTMLMAVADKSNNQILWIASQGSGIAKLNFGTGKIIRYTENEGLPDNTVYMIVPDKKGLFWCSSNNGLFRFNPADGKVTSFTKEDGIQGSEFNRYHFLETPDGHFIFGGTQGYTVFHPDSIHLDSYEVPAVISDIVVGGKPLEQAIPFWKDSIVNNIEQLTLAYNQNFIAFHFAGLQFMTPSKLHFRYKLEGFDKDWVPAGIENGANYTFIPPGHYSLTVNASNTSGTWSKHIKILSITILPPWWQTWWAYTIYILLVGGGLYAIYLNWLRQVQADNQLVLKEKEAEQLRELDEIKNQFFSNITHEFRTPLSLIIAPLEEMQRNGLPQDLKQKLVGVTRNANQLLHLINQLLDLAKLEANSMKMQLNRGDVSLFIKDIVDGFLSKAAGKQITLHFDEATTTDEYLFDADKCQKIVTNLLSNALKFTLKGGSVVIKLQNHIKNDNTDIVEITVTDNGIGIPTEKLPFIFNRFYQVDDGRTRAYEGTGIGLALVKELTELMGGTVLATNNLYKTGATFIVTIPLKKAIGAKNEVLDEVVRDNIDLFQTVPVTSQNQTASPKPLILVTEDNSELNAFIADIFRENYRVLTATNGKNGLELANKEMPDIIVSDAMMPEMDGYTFCKAIKESPETNHIAFVLLTAKTAKESVIEGLQNKADDYITKPFNVRELQLRIGNILNRRQLLRDHYSSQLVKPNVPLSPAKQDDPFLQQVYAYLNDHLDDTELTVEKLAIAVAMSQRTLTRKLQAIVGISGNEVIKQFRLKKAAELLINGSAVAEAAYATGYENTNYFSTAFKNF